MSESSGRGRTEAQLLCSRWRNHTFLDRSGRKRMCEILSKSVSCTHLEHPLCLNFSARPQPSSYPLTASEIEIGHELFSLETYRTTVAARSRVARDAMILGTELSISKLMKKLDTQPMLYKAGLNAIELDLARELKLSCTDDINRANVFLRPVSSTFTEELLEREDCTIVCAEKDLAHSLLTEVRSNLSLDLIVSPYLYLERDTCLLINRKRNTECETNVLSNYQWYVSTSEHSLATYSCLSCDWLESMIIEYCTKYIRARREIWSKSSPTVPREQEN